MKNEIERFVEDCKKIVEENAKLFTELQEKKVTPFALHQMVFGLLYCPYRGYQKIVVAQLRRGDIVIPDDEYYLKREFESLNRKLDREKSHINELAERKFDMDYLPIDFIKMMKGDAIKKITSIYEKELFRIAGKLMISYTKNLFPRFNSYSGYK